MKVTFFTNNFFPRLSGVAISANSLKKFLERIGVEVFIIAPSYRSFPRRPKEKGIMRIRSLRFWWLKRFAFPLPFLNVRKINRYLRQIQPDLIHIHQPFLLGRVGLKKGMDYKIPVVFTYHSLYERYIHYYPFSQRLCEKIADFFTLDCAHKSNAVIAPTEIIAHYLKEKGVKSRIAVIPTGIDFKQYHQTFSSNQLREFREKLGIASDKKILLYVGRIVAEKNIKFLLEVLKRVLKAKKDVVLVAVGEGTLLTSCRRITKRLKLDQQIIWTGIQTPEKLPWFYQLADLFLFPSKTDTQAIVIYEALASGLPVIAVKSLASEAIIHQGKNGFLVPEDALEFSKAVLDNLSFKYKKTVYLSEEEYSPQKIAQKTFKLYQEIIREHSFIKEKASVIFDVNELF